MLPSTERSKQMRECMSRPEWWPPARTQVSMPSNAIGLRSNSGLQRWDQGSYPDFRLPAHRVLLNGFPNERHRELTARVTSRALRGNSSRVRIANVIGALHDSSGPRTHSRLRDRHTTSDWGWIALRASVANPAPPTNTCRSDPHTRVGSLHFTPQTTYW